MRQSCVRDFGVVAIAEAMVEGAEVCVLSETREHYVGFADEAWLRKDITGRGGQTTP